MNSSIRMNNVGGNQIHLVAEFSKRLSQLKDLDDVVVLGHSKHPIEEPRYFQRRKRVIRWIADSKQVWKHFRPLMRCLRGSSCVLIIGTIVGTKLLSNA